MGNANTSLESLGISSNSVVWDPGNPRMYELRSYQLSVHGVDKFNELLNKAMPGRVSRSRIVGCWMVELGRDENRVVELWEYDSLAHRRAITTELKSDPEWRRFLQDAGPCMASAMHSQLLCPVSGNFGFMWSDQESYKLTRIRFPLESTLSASNQFNLFLKPSLDPAVANSISVNAAFQTIIGSDKEFFILVSSAQPPEPDRLRTGTSQSNYTKGATMETSLLVPLPWSQWLADAGIRPK